MESGAQVTTTDQIFKNRKSFMGNEYRICGSLPFLDIKLLA